MTWQDICRAYPEEYVLMTELDYDDATSTLRAATVIAHGKNRDELLAQNPRTTTDERAIYYTGRVSPKSVQALLEALEFNDFSDDLFDKPT